MAKRPGGRTSRAAWPWQEAYDGLTPERFAAEFIDGERCKSQALQAAVDDGWPRRRANAAMKAAILNGIAYIDRVRTARGRRPRHVLRRVVPS